MAHCPTPAQLAAFRTGNLSSEDTKTLAAHVETCVTCRDSIARLEAGGSSIHGKTPPSRAEPSGILGSGILKAGATQLSWPDMAKALTSIGTATPADLESLAEKFHASARPEAVADALRALIKEGRLTKFQAGVILQGKTGGLIFGDYIVQDRLGVGGMGQVFKAVHRKMQRVVALKVLAPSALGSPDAVNRFQREVVAAAKLVHPNIVTAFDAGTHNTQWYLAMEYVAGDDLAKLLRDGGPLPVAKAVDYTIQAARGLAFAHGRGVVHRDIKPGNLLLDADGTVKILDMGLARIDDPLGGGAAAQGELTQTGTVMGTIDYMAPEQALDTSKADAKADVYSLGCTLYRLLAGKPLFEGDTVVKKILAHREAAVPSLAAMRKDISPALDQFYRRMVAKKPEQRPTAAEVVEGLAAALADRTVVVAATTTLSSSQGKGTTSTVPVAKRISEPAAPLPPKVSRKLLASAVAGVLVLLGGVTFLLRDKSGGEVVGDTSPDGVTPISAAQAGVVVAPKKPAGGAAAPTAAAGAGTNTLPSVATAIAPPPQQPVVAASIAAVPGVASADVPGPTAVAPSAVSVDMNMPGASSATPVAADRAIAVSGVDGARVTAQSLRYDGTTPLTIEAWCLIDADAMKAKAAASTAKGFSEYILGVGGFGLRYLVRTETSDQPQWQIQYRYQNAQGGKGLGVATSRSGLPGRAWQHLAMTISPITAAEGRSELRLWIDGVSTLSSTPTVPFELCVEPFDVNSRFVGAVDEIRVSKTNRYIHDFVPQRRFTADADTLALYHCDEGMGAQLVDASGGNRHASVPTSVSWKSVGDVTGAPQTAVATATISPPVRASSASTLPASSSQEPAVVVTDEAGKVTEFGYDQLGFTVTSEFGYSSTSFDALVLQRPNEITREPAPSGLGPSYYGHVKIGRDADSSYFFRVDPNERGFYDMWFDRNRNGDLTDDGPQIRNSATFNNVQPGDGVVRFGMPVLIPWTEIVGSDKPARGYDCWLYCSEPNRTLRVTFRSSLRGMLMLDGAAYSVYWMRTPTSFPGDPATYGIAVDLNRDGRRDADEAPKEQWTLNGKTYRIQFRPGSKGATTLAAASNTTPSGPSSSSAERMPSSFASASAPQAGAPAALAADEPNVQGMTLHSELTIMAGLAIPVAIGKAPDGPLPPGTKLIFKTIPKGFGGQPNSVRAEKGELRVPFGAPEGTPPGPHALQAVLTRGKDRLEKEISVSVTTFNPYEALGKVLRLSLPANQPAKVAQGKGASFSVDVVNLNAVPLPVGENTSGTSSIRYPVGSINRWIERLDGDLSIPNFDANAPRRGNLYGLYSYSLQGNRAKLPSGKIDRQTIPAQRIASLPPGKYRILFELSTFGSGGSSYGVVDTAEAFFEVTP